MTAVETTTATPLSVLMREGSQAEHTAAEGSNFMEDLLGGRINERGYAEYLQRFLAVYEVLERVARDSMGGTKAATLIDPALDREGPIGRDLEFWSKGELTAESVLDSPATDAYRARVEASASDPLKFIAHHYTRYLGDLSGGQAIGRILSRAFGLEGGVGVDFYEFPTIEKVKLYKDSYRSNLDALDLTEEERQAVVAEVKVAFGLNQAIFNELGARPEFAR